MENTNKEKPRFPYTVKQKYIEYQDGQCCYQMADRTGFHFFRCSKPATKKNRQCRFLWKTRKKYKNMEDKIT